MALAQDPSPEKGCKQVANRAHHWKNQRPTRLNVARYTVAPFWSLLGPAHTDTGVPAEPPRGPPNAGARPPVAPCFPLSTPRTPHVLILVRLIPSLMTLPCRDCRGRRLHLFTVPMALRPHASPASAWHSRHTEI